MNEAQSEPVNIVFRVDASSVIGSGHVMRCLTLAEALRAKGVAIVFICREHPGNLSGLIETRGFAVHRLRAAEMSWSSVEDEPKHSEWLGAAWQDDAADCAAAIAFLGARPRWIVVDHYAIDARWEHQLRSLADRIMVIDDLADRPHDCDLLLDQNLVGEMATRYSGLVPGSCTKLLGPQYALLHPDYAALREHAKPRQGSVRNILVYFGATDPANLTTKATNASLSIEGHSVDVVVPAFSPQFAELKQRAAAEPRLRIHTSVPSLAPLMLTADMAIGASGATSWERLCLGLPSLVVTIADNQTPIARKLHEDGLIRWLGSALDVGQDEFRRALAEAEAAALDGEWSRRCSSVVDGYGADRVVTILTASKSIVLKPRDATAEDEELVLQWANDPETRRRAFNPDHITPQAHHTWFKARLADARNCAFYIVESAPGTAIGQVRFDQRGGEWEISYSLAPAFRGMGLGREMLNAAINRFRGGRQDLSLIGQVKPDNVASMRIFDALGFKLRSTGADRHVYERGYE